MNDARTPPRLLAIDPGNEQSAYVVFSDGKPVEFGIVPNEELLHRSVMRNCDQLAIEGIASYGMSVGKEVFDTCIWIGRFQQHFGPAATTLIYRGEVKMHLCRSMKAKDANIRQSLLDRFGPGKEKAIGKKKSPGPCYGISSHCWSALAVAVTWWDARSMSGCK